MPDFFLHQIFPWKSMPAFVTNMESEGRRTRYYLLLDLLTPNIIREYIRIIPYSIFAENP